VTILLLAALAFPLQQTPAKAVKPSKQARHRTTAKKSSPVEGISNDRASEIEDALIKAGYLERNSGRWDAVAAAAMKRYQADHHWQTKYVPDARALIALGLGPADETSGRQPLQ
jgi:hypothetical protein